MARFPIEMPNLGHGVEGGTVSGWLKAVGDAIRVGEVIAEVETDKATVELEAPTEGTLVEIVQPVGAVVPPGSPIGWIEESPG